LSGANVLCCATDAAPRGFRISNHRTPVWLLVERTCTDVFTSSDSYFPKLRYDSRYISRSPSESSCCDVPGCGTHVLPPHAWRIVPSGTLTDVNVELLMLFQSTWNRES